MSKPIRLRIRMVFTLEVQDATGMDMNEIVDKRLHTTVLLVFSVQGQCFVILTILILLKMCMVIMSESVQVYARDNED